MISYSDPGTSEKELDRRIGMAHGKFAEMKKVLCNYHLKLSIRMNSSTLTSEVEFVTAVKPGLLLKLNMSEWTEYTCNPYDGWDVMKIII